MLHPWLLVSLLLTLAAGRKELDKTPHPCKEKYSNDEVAAWVAQHLASAEPAKGTPQLLVMLGGSGAGKGTFVAKWKEVEAAKGRAAVADPISDFIFHGLDEYLPYIPEYKQTIADLEHVYKDAADACYGGGAIPAAKLAGGQIIEKKANLIYEETGKSFNRIKGRVLPPFVQAGYRITIVLIDNVADIAIQRSGGRFQSTGRYAPDDYVRETFTNNFDTYTQLKKEEGLTEFVYCDNSGAEMKCWEDNEPAIPERLVPREIFQDGKPVYRKPPNREL